MTVTGWVLHSSAWRALGPLACGCTFVVGVALCDSAEDEEEDDDDDDDDEVGGMVGGAGGGGS